jgi:hypothetical protein
MTSRPSLARSVPFWVLFVGSLVVAAVGAWLSFSKLGSMIVGLNAQTATTADVYGGQSWVVLGSVLFGAGLVGLVATLFLAVLRGLLVPAAPAEPVDEVALATDDLPFVAAGVPLTAAEPAPVVDEPVAPAPVAEASAAEEPAPAAPVEDAPVADETVDAHDTDLEDAPTDAVADADAERPAR